MNIFVFFPWNFVFVFSGMKLTSKRRNFNIKFWVNHDIKFWVFFWLSCLWSQRHLFIIVTKALRNMFGHLYHITFVQQRVNFRFIKSSPYYIHFFSSFNRIEQIKVGTLHSLSLLNIIVNKLATWTHLCVDIK